MVYDELKFVRNVNPKDRWTNLTCYLSFGHARSIWHLDAPVLRVSVRANENDAKTRKWSEPYSHPFLWPPSHDRETELHIRTSIWASRHWNPRTKHCASYPQTRNKSLSITIRSSVRSAVFRAASRDPFFKVWIFGCSSPALMPQIELNSNLGRSPILEDFRSVTRKSLTSLQSMGSQTLVPNHESRQSHKVTLSRYRPG